MALGLDDVLVGCWTDDEHGTGVSVVLPPEGTLGAIAVRGGAPGTREAAALGPTGSGLECHGVVLCGNSVFGLAAADGVVQWCVEHGRGLALPTALVPVVGAAVVYDVAASNHPRPGPESGIAACEAARPDDPPMGRVGVGRGCTVGKTAGKDHSVPGGQGWAIERSGSLVVGAIMAVNAFGDVLDERGDPLAADTADVDARRYPAYSLEDVRAWGEAPERQNTTIGCIVTNAVMTKPDACRAADLSHTGIARAIEPPHTSVDGDALFLLATGEVEASADLVAQLGSWAVAGAIRAAVRAAGAMAS